MNGNGTDDPAVSRGEFLMLAQRVDETARRMEAMDQLGTRGSGAISVQISEVIKDVATLQSELVQFRDEHSGLHRREEAARVTARRWTIATAIAFLAAVEGPLIYLIHVH